VEFEATIMIKFRSFKEDLSMPFLYQALLMFSEQVGTPTCSLRVDIRNWELIKAAVLVFDCRV